MKRAISILLSACILSSVLFVIPINVSAASSVIEKAISWAISIANDNSHGYSQSSRWGPDYDCSSFVISAFKSAGVNTGTATYTGNMRSQFTQHGFQWIPWSQIGSTANLKRGDILLNEVSHTEIYLGNNQNVGAHSNRGYPQTGDQTGTEVSVSGYYNHPWDGVLRYVADDICSCSNSYAGDYIVSTESKPLTMRSGHGTGYSIVTSIPKGSQVYVSKADGSWAHVEWNGYSGYCSMEYLTKMENKSYNLHVWVSDTEMGNVPGNFVLNNKYYICYELIDEITGQPVSPSTSMNYRVTETIRNSEGKVFEHTYTNSNRNWISTVCNSEDTYTGTVTVTGDVNISCSVSFEVWAKTGPQIKIWAWEDDDSNEIDSIEVGETAYCSYLIRDKYSNKNLNDATAYWVQGNGYTVKVQVFDPYGKLIKSASYKNNDCTWFSFVPKDVGEYTIKTEVSGKLNGSYEDKVTVLDNTKPTILSIIPTNKISPSQTVITELSDNVGIAGYYWGTSSYYRNNKYTSTASEYISETVSEPGIYYLTIKDTSGNLSDTVSLTFYRTILNANGGSVSVSSILTYEGNSIMLPKPSRNNYTYKGWSESPTASSGTQVLTPNKNSTLYAVWEHSDTEKPSASIMSSNNISPYQILTFKFSDNVGIAGFYWGTSNLYSKNQYMEYTGTTVQRTLSSPGTYYLTVKDTSGNISSNATITLYKTTLNGNGGTVSPNEVLTMKGNSFDMPVPKRDGYTFLGWATSSTASSGIYELTPADSSTYYAVWNKNTSDLILGDTDGDGLISIGDATTIQKYITKIVGFDERQKMAADVNKDGVIDIKDATQIQKYLARIITEF